MQAPQKKIAVSTPHAGNVFPTPAPWINNLSLVLLSAMLLYTIIGIPDFNRDATIAAASDHVSPLNRFIWLILLAGSMPVAIMRWRLIARLALASWPLMLVYVYFILSVTWALDPPIAGRRIMFAFVQLALTMILLAGLRKAATLHVVIAISCILAAAADMAVWIIMPGYAMTPEGLAGLQLQKNQTGLLMMYGLLATISGMWLLRTRWQKSLAVGAIGLMLLLLVASKSKTSEAIVVVVPCITYGLRWVSMQRFLVQLLVYTAILTIMLGSMLSYLAWCGATGIDPFLPLRGMTFTSRTDLWSFMLGEIARRPWLGAGFSSFWSIDPAIQPSLKTDMWFGEEAHINEAHEGYLDLLATGGIIGFVLGISTLLYYLLMAIRIQKYMQPGSQAWRTGLLSAPTAFFYLCFLVALVIHNFTESNLFSNNSLLAVALFIAIIDMEKWRISCPRAHRYAVPARGPSPHPAHAVPAAT
ncbi:O-antigen ligase family protein [Komagataeibacter swingsii]|uniref:O-antigen ligase-related domain-containing protein n=1 Tax=Komagataeibacter swingsii TaxID=215220 RepID=A0A2V4RLD9_9PROT|nr:O-antigen ligase family protein [Komagataeibacter swingsii]PYD69485.1 hypothetical protein CFR76_09130 [Komagataeibacter swingsii]GBQ59575.1 O-antigen polymerase [Komagataeibacter swingsii DSM 16373]